MLGDSFGCPNWEGGCSQHLERGGQDVAEYPTVQGKAPPPNDPIPRSITLRLRNPTLKYNVLFRIKFLVFRKLIHHSLKK